MDLNGRPMADRAGAAKRRRERRLRSWLRHERMTVAAELSAALHHSRDGGREQYVGPRAQKSDSSAVVEEVENETHAAPRGQITPPPTQTVPVLAGRAAEAVDSSALSFLLSQSLLAEQEAKEAEELERLIWPPGSRSCWRRSRGSARRRHAVPAARPLKPLQPGGRLPSWPRRRRSRRGGGKRGGRDDFLALRVLSWCLGAA